MLRKLRTKDKIEFNCFICDLKLSKSLFSKFVRQEKLAFISEENDNINGLIYVEKEDKKNYLNILSKSKKITNNLLKIFFWNYKKDIFAKIHEKDKTGFILKKNGFRIVEKIEDYFILYYNPKEKGKRYDRSNNRKHNNNYSRFNKRPK